MIKYEIKTGSTIVSISLDATSPNQRALLIYDGDKLDVQEIKSIIESSYGAFGHIIGAVTSPIDLHSALNKSKLSFSQVGGLRIKNYDPDIPEGAMT